MLVKKDGVKEKPLMMEKTLATIRRGAMLALGTLLATAPAMGQLVVNEIDYDQSGTDSAEFIEIKNISGGAVNLDPFALELVNGNDDAVYLTIDLPNVNLPAGQYYVVCGDAAIVENCDLDTTPEQNLVQNGAPDALAIVQGASIIDAVSYEGDVAPPYIEGSGVGLEDDPNVTNAGISRFPVSEPEQRRSVVPLFDARRDEQRRHDELRGGGWAPRDLGDPGERSR